ncbi:MAG: hypothetical protein M3430_09495 [Acidobacteriota bacterium]|nr:hypothetical protein [Acidobacteriota bacterium]
MLLVLMLTTLMLPTPLPGVECSVPGSPTEELRKSKAVFTGKVIGRKYVMDNPSGVGFPGQRLVIRLQVERVWKGEIGEEVLMYTSWMRQLNGSDSTSGEDFGFENSQRYLIYAGGTLERLSTSACTRSRELGKAGDDLKELGEGHEPTRKKK